MGLMTSTIKGARSPTQGTNTRQRASSADFPTRAAYKYKVLDEDQGFFYGWNYVNQNLVEDTKGAQPGSLIRNFSAANMLPPSKRVGKVAATM
jgi:hypothetical protein